MLGFSKMFTKGIFGVPEIYLKDIADNFTEALNSMQCKLNDPASFDFNTTTQSVAETDLKPVL